MKKIKIMTFILSTMMVVGLVAILNTNSSVGAENYARDIIVGAESHMHTPSEMRGICEMDAMECYKTLVDNGLVIPEQFSAMSEEQIAVLVKDMADVSVKQNGLPKLFNFQDNMLLSIRVNEVVIQYENIQINDSQKNVNDGIKEALVQYY